MAKFIWDTGENAWVSIEQFRPKISIAAGPMVIGDIEPFLSPVTDKLVGSRSQLRQHNRDHNVVDRREFRGYKFTKSELSSPRQDVAHAFKQHTGRL